MAVPDTLAQRLQACTACHGQQGRAGRQGYLPRIAGKPSGYLYSQLLNFRDGRRANATMAEMLSQQTDAYLAEMAGHFAALDLPYAPPQPSDAPLALLARGEALALRGDATRRLPACTTCHGQRLTGTLPAVPGLLGLPRDYLVAQLGGWKTHTRQAEGPDCMARLAARMAPADISAVAAWLAQQPVPQLAKPQAGLAATPPLDCGPAVAVLPAADSRAKLAASPVEAAAAATAALQAPRR